MKAMRGRYLFAVAFVPVAIACSSNGFVDDDGGADSSVDAPKLGETKDGSTSDVVTGDAPADAVVDATEIDEASDAGDILDAAPDVVEAGVLGGDICPGIGLCKGACSCDAGYTHQWSVKAPDAGTSYLCENGGAPTNPECPKGWMCSGYNSSNKYVTVTCP